MYVAAEDKKTFMEKKREVNSHQLIYYNKPNKDNKYMHVQKDVYSLSVYIYLVCTLLINNKVI